MTRGNQREKAREKNQKAAGAAAKKSTMSGAEQAAAKDRAAAIMREKQAKGEYIKSILIFTNTGLAEEKKKAEAAGSKK